MEGIDIKTEDGTVLGKSKVAATTAVAQVRYWCCLALNGSICPPRCFNAPTHRNTHTQRKPKPQVVPSRILMATPGMFFPPMIMSRLESSALLKASPGLGAPIMVRALDCVHITYTENVCVCVCVLVGRRN